MTPKIDFQDPQFRAELLCEVGPDEFGRIMLEYWRLMIVDGIGAFRSQSFGWVFQEARPGRSANAAFYRSVGRVLRAREET
jgi:hypothetical protein